MHLLPSALQHARVLALTVACAAVPSFAHSEPMKIESMSPERAAIQLLEPRGDRPWVAGSALRLAWDWAGGRAQEIEEWEAFLSLDGGVTFPLRITPHLDGERRDVLFEVPDLPAADARLLIRFGNERDETAVEFPQSFRIHPSSTAGWKSVTTPSMPASDEGEAALEGSKPVVSWVDGPRDGSRRWRVDSDVSQQLGGHVPQLMAQPIHHVALCPSPPRPNELGTGDPGIALQATPACWQKTSITEPLAPLSPLARTSRLNE